MKTIIRITLFLCFAVLAGFKTADKNLVHSIGAQPFFDEDEDEFVELMDGKIIKGNVTKCNVFKTNSFKGKNTGSVIIDEVKYEHKDIMAVQYKKNHYRKNSEGEFAKRTDKGRINIYYSISFGMHASASDYINYVQKGEQGPLVFMSLENIKIMVSDYGPALAAIEKYENQTEKERRKRGLLPTYESIFIYNKQ